MRHINRARDRPVVVIELVGDPVHIGQCDAVNLDLGDFHNDLRSSPRANPADGSISLDHLDEAVDDGREHPFAFLRRRHRGIADMAALAPLVDAHEAGYAIAVFRLGPKPVRVQPVRQHQVGAQGEHERGLHLAGRARAGGARLLDRVELRRHHLPPRGAPYPRLRVHLLQILLRHEIYHSRRQRATRHRPRRERCLSPLLGDADLSILEAPRQMKKVIEEALKGD